MNNTIACFSDVEFSYGNSPLLEHVDFSICRHDFIGVVGANGSGKTTLVKLLSGHLKAVSGKITYYDSGKEVPYLTIGYLPQYAAIDKRFPLSVKKVVESGLISPRNMWRPFLRYDEHRNVSNVMENLGLSDLASKSISDLSGGELQRTMLARAVVSNPHLLLLDEPDTYLDAESETRLFELLKNINRNCTILLVSHDLSSVLKHCNRVACVNRSVSVIPVASATIECIKEKIGISSI